MGIYGLRSDLANRQREWTATTIGSERNRSTRLAIEAYLWAIHRYKMAETRRLETLLEISATDLAVAKDVGNIAWQKEIKANRRKIFFALRKGTQ